MQNIRTILKQQKVIVETLQKGEDGKDGKGISSIKINDNGELEITYTDGETVNLGMVKGSDGKNGEQGIQGTAGTNGKDGKGISSIKINDNGELEITYTDGETVNLGMVKGSDGKNGEQGIQGTAGTDGKDGKGILSIKINDNGELEITYTDGESVNLGVIKSNSTLTASDIKATDEISDSSAPVELSVQEYLNKIYSMEIVTEQKLPVWNSEESILTECTTILSQYVQNDLSTDGQKWIAIPFTGNTISIAFPGVSTYNSSKFGQPIIGTLEDGVLGDGESVLWSSGEKYTPEDKYGSKGITSVKFTTTNSDYNCIVVKIADSEQGYDYSDSYIASEENIEAWNIVEAYKVAVFNPQSGNGIAGLLNTDHYTFRDVQARALLSNFSENEKGELLYKGKQVNSGSVDLSEYYTKGETDEKISTIIDNITAEIKGL